MAHVPHSAAAALRSLFTGLSAPQCLPAFFPAVGTRPRPHSSLTWKRCRHQRVGGNPEAS